MVAPIVFAGIERLLSIGEKLLDKTPDYDQKKKEVLYKLRAKFEHTKTHRPRDLDLFMDLRDAIHDWFDVFLSET